METLVFGTTMSATVLLIAQMAVMNSTVITHVQLRDILPVKMALFMPEKVSYSVSPSQIFLTKWTNLIMFLRKCYEHKFV